jgi:hypothetical protein
MSVSSQSRKGRLRAATSSVVQMTNRQHLQSRDRRAMLWS